MFISVERICKNDQLFDSSLSRTHGRVETEEMDVEEYYDQDEMNVEEYYDQDEMNVEEDYDQDEMNVEEQYDQDEIKEMDVEDREETGYSSPAHEHEGSLPYLQYQISRQGGRIYICDLENQSNATDHTE